jgi:hypothetical protein
MLNEKFLVGADPEFAITANNKVFPQACVNDSPYNLIPPAYFRLVKKYKTDYLFSDKLKKHPVFYNENGLVIHEDGANAEVTLPPTNDWRILFEGIQGAYNIAKNLFKCDEVLNVAPLPTTYFNNDFWITFGKEMKLATIAGCDPDIDIDNFENPNSTLIDLSKHNERYCGGHIHLSTNDPKIKENFEARPVTIIRFLKVMLGITCVAFSPSPILDKKRLFYYGKPGRYRKQDYKTGYIGYEYRSPSTAWTSDRKLAKKLFERVEQAANIMDKDFDYIYKITTSLSDKASEIIVNFDTAAAREMYEEVDNLL